MDGFNEKGSAAAGRGSSKRKRERKADWLTALSSAQLVLACLGVALLMIVSKVSPVTFAALRDEFNYIMQTDMMVREVFVRIHSVFEPEIRVNTQTNESESTEFPSGGEDVEIYEAEKNVCFAPFDTTVKTVMPVKGKITSRFGYRYHPITGKFGVHNGTDIAAEEGTPIAAAFNGVVEEVGFNSVRGNYILLAHGENMKTLYLHCSEILAPQGAAVRQGEIIATVGSTGYSTGPHLHFSVIIGGKYCNPEWLLNDI